MNNAVKTKFMGIDVPADLTKMNFLTLYACTTLGALVTNSINGIQHSYLKDILKVPQESFGTVSGTMMTVGEIAAIVFLFVFGALSDNKGRRFVLTIGLIGASIAYVLFYNCHNLAEIFGVSGVLLAYFARFILVATLAGVWATFIIITADYTDMANRAKGMAFNGAFTGVGMLLAMGLFASLPKFIGTRNTFYLVSVVAILTLIYVRIGLVDRIRSDEKHTGQFGKVIEVLKTSPQLVMCYAARLFIMASVVTVGTFPFVWAVNVARDHGVTPEAAQMKIGMYIGIAGLVSFVGFPIFAILCDRIGRYKTMAISLGIAGVSLISFGFIANPLSTKILICFVGFFISQSGMLVSSQTLASDLAPKHIMGTILGGLNTVGQIGAAVFFTIDGFSMDLLGGQAPYIIMGIFCLTMIAWVLAVQVKGNEVAACLR